jgi:streptogramin lyase
MFLKLKSGGLFSFLATAAPALLLASSLFAQEAKKSAYPRINLATWYQVDAAWPRKPENLPWGEMPGLAVDSRDQVWIYTRAVPPVQLYSAGGEFIRSFGEGIVKKAHHIKLDGEGKVWLADIGSHAVFQFSPEGKLLRTLGTPGAAGADQSHLNQPTDMAITAAGEVFISDGYGNNRVVHYDAEGRFVKSWGELGSRPGEFSLPHAIVLDPRGRLYVADRNNARVQVFDQEGKLLSEWRDLLVPWGLWVTPAGDLWACGSSPMAWRKGDSNLGVPPKDQLFMKLSPEGKVLQLWTVPKGKDGAEEKGELNWVHCLALDSKGNIYAGDIKGKRAQKFVKQE